MPSLESVRFRILSSAGDLEARKELHKLRVRLGEVCESAYFESRYCISFHDNHRNDHYRAQTVVALLGYVKNVDAYNLFTEMIPARQRGYAAFYGDAPWIRSFSRTPDGGGDGMGSIRGAILLCRPC